MLIPYGQLRSPSLIRPLNTVWARSSHTNLVDTQLNSTMRTISGTIRSTALPWLPVLCNIASPDIRREASTAVLVAKVQAAPRSTACGLIRTPDGSFEI